MCPGRRPFCGLRRLLACGLLAVLAIVALPVASAGDAPDDHAAGPIEYETKSAYSHIRIRKRGDVRTLLFVRDNGAEAWQSQVDLREPQVLKFDVLKNYAASFLLVPQPKALLIVGLGGGGMVHFLRHIAPDLRIDVVEIDPEVIRIADRYFNVRAEGKTRIINGDGLKYLAETQERYDVIQLDAFLKPSAETDGTGAPLNLRTRQFYKEVQSKLSPGGLVAFNLNLHDKLGDDIRNIALTFPQVYVFPLEYEAMMLGSIDPAKVAVDELERRGDELDRRIRPPSLSFRELARRVHR